MATRLLSAQESSDVTAKSVDVVQRGRRQETIDFGEIAKGRARQCILTIQCPGDLSGIERNCHLVGNGQMERLRQIVVRTTLRIKGAKEPQLVLLDWPTDVTTEIDF